jgi:outer membrane protein TolC
LPFELVDATPPVCDLVSRALAAGPGIREAEGLLNTIQSGIAKANGPSRFLPVFEVRMAEGAFGAGPGDSMNWDNRWDMGLQARWDLSTFATAEAKQRAADARLRQASANLTDVRGKLTSGVYESRDTILSAREQLPLAQQRIKFARDAYQSYLTLRPQLEDKRTIIRELIENIRTLREAEFGYLDTISAYDRAQVRLILLLGPTAPPPGGHCP